MGTSGRRGMSCRRTTLLVSAGVALGFSSGAQLPRGTAPPSEPQDAQAIGVSSGAHPSRPGPARGRETHVLPDSVLVRIGRRDIVRSFAVRRWREQRGAVPADSITPRAARRFLALLTDEAILTDAAVREAA